MKTLQAEFSVSEHPRGLVSVTVAPHPFAVERVQHKIAAGQSLAVIAERAQPDGFLRRYGHIHIDGHYIPQENWARVYPKAGAIVSIRMVPMGGGGSGKSTLRTVLSIAIIAASPMIAGAVLGALSVSSTAVVLGVSGSQILSAGVSLLGRLALNALAPPGRARFSSGVRESPTLFIQGARNQVSPFARVPQVLGKHRMVPPLGALPYTETAGSEQYLRMLFVWGYGPLQISDLKIGETPLSDFEGVEIETRQGYPDDAPLSLYSDSVIQNDLQVSVTHAGGAVIRTTETGADEISVDITFPRGLFFLTNSGAKAAATVSVTVGYSLKGMGVWTDETFSYTAAQSAALRKNVRFLVPNGQYDVRVSRVTVDAVSDSLFDESVWTALRTVRTVYPIKMQGLAMTALRIKASDQINGVIDRFNGVVQCVIPDWDGASWAPQVTSNPAAIYRYILQGRANARPLDDTRLDLAKIEAWHESCSAQGREFNAVIDYDVSVREMLRDVAAAGRAAPSLIDGKWAVVEDKPQFVPVQHFTPRNTYGFSGEKSFDDLPHALRMRFVNRDKGWLQDEVLVFDDGYDETTATKYEALELSGVTSAAQAWKDGRYHIATARLRPESYSFNTDMEHIVCTRGDLIRFTHDVPLFGLKSARVKSVLSSGGSDLSVILDAMVLMEAGKDYAVRFRTSDGSSLLMPLVLHVGESDTLEFVTPCLTGSGPQPGDLALFGESGQESVELIVKSIEPQGNLAAKITCVDAAPAIHTADSGAIPLFSAQITVPPEMQRPPAPVVTSIQSGDAGLVRSADGALTAAVILTLAPAIFSLPLSVDVRIRQPEETDFHPAQFMAGGDRIILSGATPGQGYDIKILYKSLSGISSPPTVIANYHVADVTGIPGDVTNLSLNISGGSAYLSWDAVSGIDLAGYRIRYNDSTAGAVWSNSFEILSSVSRTATSISLPAQTGTWLIKAFNGKGRESLNAAAVPSTLGRIEGYVSRFTADETPHFGDGIASPAGTSSGVAFSGDDHLVLASGAMEGLYYFEEAFSLSAVYASLLSPSISISGVSADNAVDGWGDVDLIEDWDGSASPSVWSVQLQVRMTPDDPAGTPSWSGWQDFIVGEYTARAFQFRLKMESTIEGITPSVSLLKIDLYMRSWAQSNFNITSNSSDDFSGHGTRISLAEQFHDYTAVTLTPHDMATGDYYVLDSKDQAGFCVRFYNAAGSRVTRTFDYIAQGIGRKVSS
jgi:hypothetical protein